MSNFISNATSRGTQPRITKTQQVRTLITLRPLMTNKQIAEQLECDISLVYQIRKGMLTPAPKPPKATTDNVTSSHNVGKSKPVAVIKEPVAVIKEPVAVIKEPKEPTIKQACDVILKAIDGIDGVDVTLYGTTVVIDHDGDRYECKTTDVERVITALKTLNTFTQ